MFPSPAAMPPPTDQFAQQPDQEQQPDLVAMFEEGLKQLVQDEIHTDMDVEKTYQLADIRKNEYYWRGVQFLRRTVTEGGTTDWAPLFPTTSTGPTQDQGEDLYSYIVNDIRSYGRKFIGVLAQQPPSVKALPNKRTDEDHIRRARKAQSALDILHGLWDLKYISRQIALSFWKAGTPFLYTPYVADADKYGITEEPILTDQQIPISPAQMRCINCGSQTPLDEGGMPPMQCPGPGCGMDFGPEDYIEPETVAFPIPSGKTEKYPNGAPECHVYNGMYVTTPFSIRRLADTPWLELTYDENRSKILASYERKPDIYKRLKAMAETDVAGSDMDGAAEIAARTTRDLAQSPLGTTVLPHKHRWQYTRIWIRPAQYHGSKSDVSMDGENMPLRKALQQQFPKGLKMTWVQGKLVELEEEEIDYVWSMEQGEPAENAYPDPLCKDMLSSQDLTNHCTNIIAEALERMIPQTAIDVDMISPQFRRKNELPASFVPMRRKGGKNLSDSVVGLAVAKPEPELATYPANMREHAADGCGITPILFGGGDQPSTAYATNLLRNQAMMQLAPYLDALRSAVARAEYNAVMQMAKHSGGRIPDPHSPKTQLEQIDGIEELAEGGWHCEAEDAMPQGWSERRAALLELMEKNPGSLQQLGYAEIDNIPIIQDTLIGLPDWKVPQSDDLHKVNNVIRRLLTQQPIEPPPMMVPPGMPPPPPPELLPSIPPDLFEDNHAFVADAVRRWAQTEDAQQEREKNPAGYANVIAWGKAHAMMAMPPPMPGDPGLPPGPPNGGPPTSGPPGQSTDVPPGAPGLQAPPTPPG